MTIWQKVIQVNDWHVYFISGLCEEDMAQSSKQCYCFDIRYRTITKIAKIIQERSGFGLCHIKEKIYVCAGRLTHLNRLRSFGGFSLQNEGEHLTKLFRIDTLQVDPEWETIQVSSKEPVPYLCQLGLFNLSNNFPQIQNTGNHEFIIFGGVNLDFDSDTFAYYCKLQNESQGDWQVDKNPNLNQIDQASGDQQLKVEISKMTNQLTIGDRLYYNQWLQLQNKRDCKQWFIMGRTAGHYVNFDTQDLNSNKQLAYDQLLDKY
eukprot:403349129